jgi:hypothetical protein
MTIVLQHQFWDLRVAEEDFEVGLAFNGIPERLHVPLKAVKAFLDPSVQFGLQFTVEPEAGAAKAETPAAAPVASAPERRKPKPELKQELRPPQEIKPPQEAPAPAKGKKGEAAPAAPSGEVVRLDRFRKK